MEAAVQLTASKVSKHVHANTVPFYFAVNGCLEAPIYMFISQNVRIPTYMEFFYLMCLSFAVFFNLVIKTRSYAITDTINVTIALSTSIFWGYLSDIVLFGADVDILCLVGAVFVIFGSILNIQEK